MNRRSPAPRRVDGRKPARPQPLAGPSTSPRAALDPRIALFAGDVPRGRSGASFVELSRMASNHRLQRLLSGASRSVTAAGPQAAVPLVDPATPGEAPGLHRQEEDDAPTEAEKARALAQAKAAEARAGDAKSKSQAGAAQAKAEGAAEKQKSQSAKAEAKASAAKAKGKKRAKPARRDEPQDGAGPEAAAEAGIEVAVEEGRQQAPRSPDEDPAFLAVKGNVDKASARARSHPPAGKKAADALAAAESPANEVDSRAQAAQVEQMEQAPAPSFDRATFKAKLMEKIRAAAPRTAQEADDFKSGGKVAGIKGEMDSEVEGQKEQSSAPLEETAGAAPDPSGFEPRSATPLPPTDAGALPVIPGVEQATPKQKGRGEVEAPLKEEAASLDSQMAEADIDEEQLAQSNEPEFQEALGAKREAKEHAAEGPQEYRAQEEQQIAQAREDAKGTSDEKLSSMHEEKGELLQQVAGKQGEAKGVDEGKRAKVIADIEAIYERSRSSVERILADLDGKVSATFDAGAEAARQSFENYVESRMRAYKQRRYGGWLGWARWAKDKIAGMPSAVNAFYKEGSALYLRLMDAVIDRVAAIVEAGLNEAKAEVARGREEIAGYVAQLPEDLREVGEQAAEQIQERFDELERSVDAKQDELIDGLAQKYQEHLQALNDRIEELKAANQGLVQRAFGAIAGVVRTILQLKDMLLSVLAEAAGAVKMIIKSPIGFLRNLLDGVKSGFDNFVSNIVTHIKKGLMTWLFGAIAATGIQLPESFDLRGILNLVMQVLGLTWSAIRGLAVRVLGERVVGVLEQSFEIFVAIKDRGLGGLFDFVKDRLSDLRDRVMDQVQDMVITQVIKAGVQWLIGILGGPAGAFIKAARAIYDVVMWFLNNGSRVMMLVRSIIKSISSIATGNISAAAAFIEQSLANAIPVVIGFLASLLGLGNLGEKVRAIIQTVRKPVEQAITWVLNKAKAFAQRVMGRLTGRGEQEEAPSTLLQDVRRTMEERADRGFRTREEADVAAQEVHEQYRSAGLRSLSAVADERAANRLRFVAVASPPMEVGSAVIASDTFSDEAIQSGIAAASSAVSSAVQHRDTRRGGRDTVAFTAAGQGPFESGYGSDNPQGYANTMLTLHAERGGPTDLVQELVVRVVRRGSLSSPEDVRGALAQEFDLIEGDPERELPSVETVRTSIERAQSAGRITMDERGQLRRTPETRIPEISPTRRAGAFDQGIEGQYYASHAERQAYNAAGPGQKFIGISHSDGPCPACVGYFTNLANSNRELVVIAYPGGHRVFTPRPGTD